MVKVSHYHAVQKPNAVALSMQEAQWKRLENVTNNIANAQTPGFKASFLKLETIQHKNKTKDSREVDFVHANKQSRNNNDGSFHATNNPLDVCLSGDGFFMVDKFFTRNGQFLRNKDGDLVTANGAHKVMSESGTNIAIPNTVKNININSSGEIYGDGEFLGKIGVFKLENNQDGLKNMGSGLYKANENNKSSAATKYYLKQGGIEESNVSVMEEGILMIKILREYENAQKIMEQDDQNKKMMLNISQRNAQ